MTPTLTLEETIEAMLHHIGENPQREGLRNTPDRVARMYQELTAGYHQTEEEVIGDALFKSERAELIVVGEIPFYSLCEHHLLPFFGHCTIAYVPKESIIGLSKLGRIVELYAKRLQIQEGLTHQILGCVERQLQPLGVAVKVEAQHLCMAMRGVHKPGTVMRTTSCTGVLGEDSRFREELLANW